MKIVSEFREFISRGSVIDLAVGVIIGAAFNKIVSALVDEVVMPVVGLLTTGVDFGQLKIVLREAAGKQPEVAIRYGSFINAIVQFLIVALTVFFMVKSVNYLRRFTAKQDEEAKAAAPEPAPSTTDALLMQIRDLLKGEPAQPPPARQKRSTAAKSR